MLKSTDRAKTHVRKLVVAELDGRDGAEKYRVISAQTFEVIV